MSLTQFQESTTTNTSETEHKNFFDKVLDVSNTIIKNSMLECGVVEILPSSFRQVPLKRG